MTKRPRPTWIPAALAVGLLAPAPAARSQSLASAAATAETVRHLRADVTYLTSETLKGRRAGTAEADAAAAYVAESFRRIGLLPGAKRGSYLQTFEFLDSAVPGPKHRLSVARGEEKKTWPTSAFLPLPFSLSGDAEGSVVFAGHGVVAPALGRDDYAGADVRGRVVLVLRGSGRTGDAAYTLAPFSTPRAKAEAALARGAAALLVVGEGKSGRDDLLRVGDAAFSSVALPVLAVKRELAETLFEGSEKTLEGVEKAFEDGKSAPLGLPARVALTADFSPRRLRTANVIGVLPGGDTAINTEIVVVGAHYDHLGLGGAGSREPGTAAALHPGADDNASGVAGILELARHFAARRVKLRRSLLFIAFGGEEEGTLGSLFFTRNPTAPLASLLDMVNLDMVGRLRDDRVEVHGAGASPAFRPALEKANEEARLRLSLKDAGGGPSDHAAFSAAGIPALLFFTGIHDDYHRVTDTAEKLDYEGEAKILRLIAIVIESLANEGEGARKNATLGAQLSAGGVLDGPAGCQPCR